MQHISIPFQLSANTLVFMCVNLGGIFVHNLMEHAQRRTFLDTRNCIAARLEMEEENEKLVKKTFYRWRGAFVVTSTQNH